MPKVRQKHPQSVFLSAKSTGTIDTSKAEKSVSSEANKQKEKKADKQEKADEQEKQGVEDDEKDEKCHVRTVVTSFHSLFRPSVSLLPNKKAFKSKKILRAFAFKLAKPSPSPSPSPSPCSKAVQAWLLKGVDVVSQVAIEATRFAHLYVLHCLETKHPLQNLDQQFYETVLGLVCQMRRLGKNKHLSTCKDANMLEFYQQQYLPLTSDFKRQGCGPERTDFEHIIKSLRVQLITNAQVFLQTQFTAIHRRWCRQVVEALIPIDRDERKSDLKTRRLKQRYLVSKWLFDTTLYEAVDCVDAALLATQARGGLESKCPDVWTVESAACLAKALADAIIEFRTVVPLNTDGTLRGKVVTTRPVCAYVLSKHSKFFLPWLWHLQKKIEAHNAGCEPRATAEKKKAKNSRRRERRKLRRRLEWSALNGKQRKRQQREDEQGLAEEVEQEEEEETKEAEETDIANKGEETEKKKMRKMFSLMPTSGLDRYYIQVNNTTLKEWLYRYRDRPNMVGQAIYERFQKLTAAHAAEKVKFAAERKEAKKAAAAKKRAREEEEKDEEVEEEKEENVEEEDEEEDREQEKQGEEKKEKMLNLEQMFVKEFNAEKQWYWQQLFNLKPFFAGKGGLRKNGFNFGFSFKTNGVGVSLCLKKPMTKEEFGASRKKEASQSKAALNFSESENEVWSVPVLPESVLEKTRVLAIDPGKRDVYSSAEDVGEAKHKIQSYSAKRWMHESGANRARRLREVWAKRKDAKSPGFSEWLNSMPSTKVSSTQALMTHIRHLAVRFNECFELNGQQRVRRLRFCNYIKRQQGLATMFNELLSRAENDPVEKQRQNDEKQKKKAKRAKKKARAAARREERKKKKKTESEQEKEETDAMKVDEQAVRKEEKEKKERNREEKKEEKPKTIVVFGDATFASNGPYLKLKRMLRERAGNPHEKEDITLVPLNEYCTSKYCSNCAFGKHCRKGLNEKRIGKVEKEVAKEEKGEKEEKEVEEEGEEFAFAAEMEGPLEAKREDGKRRSRIHGVRICKRCGATWNRDVNASIGMLQLYWHAQRNGGARHALFKRAKEEEENAEEVASFSSNSAFSASTLTLVKEEVNKDEEGEVEGEEEETTTENAKKKQKIVEHVPEGMTSETSALAKGGNLWLQQVQEGERQETENGVATPHTASCTGCLVGARTAFS